MSSLARPRGPLPPRVYWVRRVLVLGTALALVLGIGNLLRLGSDGSGDDPSAVQVAGDSSDSAQSEPTADRTKRKHHSRKPTKTPLPSPDGPCEPGDVVITPVVKDAVGGSPVKIRLKMSTRVSPACTWQLSSDSLTFKITRDSATVWSSLECPRMIESEDLVLRQSKPTWSSVTWNARYSKPGCPQETDWARAGWYHLAAAAFDGEPTDTQFRLALPTAATITASPRGGDKPGDGSTKKPGDGSTKKPGHKPSGAVEPSGH